MIIEEKPILVKNTEDKELKTIYQKLLPQIKENLDRSAFKYSSARRLKHTLMSKVIWQDLTVNDVSSLLTFANISTYKESCSLALYGDNILIK